MTGFDVAAAVVVFFVVVIGANEVIDTRCFVTLSKNKFKVFFVLLCYLKFAQQQAEIHFHHFLFVDFLRRTSSLVRT